MFFLDTVSKSFQIVLAAAATTNDCPWTVTWADLTTTTFTAGAGDGTSSGTTLVSVVSAPPTATQRQIKYFSLFNADTVATQVFVQVMDSSAFVMLAPTLDVGETLIYDEHNGWQVLQVGGGIKAGFVGPTGPTGATGAPGTKRNIW
jgi:hypothetical protein